MKTDMKRFKMPKKLLMVALVLILAVVCVFAETRTVYDEDELKGAFDDSVDNIVLGTDFSVALGDYIVLVNNTNLFLNGKSLTFTGLYCQITDVYGYSLDVYGGANASDSSISGSLRDGIWLDEEGFVVNIHSGTIESIYVQFGTLNVSGGNVSNICPLDSHNKYINISGGNISGIDLNEGSSASISGGYIDGLVVESTASISISGGYFSSEPQSSWIASGYCVVDNTDAGTKAQYPYKVVPHVAVTGVSLNKSSTQLTVGSTETLTATVSPANATYKTVSWTSSNTSVATVNSTGTVTAVGSGSATITATTTDGSRTATCTVSVPHTHPSTAVGGEVSFSTPISSIGELKTFLSSGGSGYLTADITLDRSLLVSNTVRLCLNGHVINMGGSYYLFHVDSNADFRIYDCGTTEHKFAVDSSTGLYTLDENGSVSLSGGVITGGGSSVAYLYGTSCSVTVYGGNFVGNKKLDSNGGAVFSMNSNTSLIINGGYYAGNYTTGKGAVISTLSASGEIHINGGVLANNKAEKDGGAIYSKTSLYITGGEIKNNTAISCGGAVCEAFGSITMTGGRITGNTSQKGAGLWMDDNYSPIYVTGGEISGNTITSNSNEFSPCGVFIRNSNSVIGGSAIISGNTTSDGATRNIYVQSGRTFKLESPSFGFHSSISSGDEGSNEINITSTSATTTYDYSQIFDAENPDYYIASAENETSGNHGVLKKYLTFSPYVTNVSKTYDGSSSGITVNPRVDGATVKYGTVAGTYNLSASPTYSNVGFNIVNYQITKDGYKPYSGSGTVTINAATMTVSGSNYNAAYDGLPHGTAATPSVVTGTTVEYSTSDDGGSTWSTWSTNVPQRKDVGTTNVKVKTTNSNYNEAQGNYTLTVTPKAVTVTSENKTKTYGTVADPALTATVTGLVSDETVIYDLGRASGETVGDYTISPSGATSQGNYAVSYVASGKLTITAASTMTVSGRSYNVTYDGQAHGDAATAIVPDGTTATVEYSYSTDNGANWSSWSTTVPKRTDVGTTTVKVKATNPNYVTAEDNYSITVSVASIPVSVSNYSGTYDGSAHGITVTPGVAGATVKYGTVEGTYDLSASPTYTDTGVYTVYYKVTKTGYSPYSGSATVTINAASMTVSGSAYDGTYDGSAHGITVTPGVAGATVMYGTVEGTYNLAAPPTYTDTGIYTVYYKVTKTGYTPYSGSATVTINAAAMTVSGSAYNAPYDGLSHGVAATASITAGTTVKYSTDGGSTWSTTVPERTDVGTTNVRVRAINPNYVTAEESYTLTVTAKAVTVTSDNKTKVYGEADPTFTATVTGTVGTDTVSYVLGRAAGDAVGEYVITPSGDAVQGNYSVTYVATGRLTIAGHIHSWSYSMSADQKSLVATCQNVGCPIGTLTLGVGADVKVENQTSN